MKIAFLNDSISRMAGGVFEVQRRLAQNLLKISGVSIQIVGLEDEHTYNDVPLWQPFQPVIYKKVGPKGLAYSPKLIKTLRSNDSDLIHLHVLWRYPSVASLQAGKPYITTIHGMLDSWALKNSQLKKKVVAALFEKAALQKATCLQAFTWQEYKDIRNFNLKTPVCIIPNGVDLPQDVAELKAEAPVWRNSIEPGKKVMLYLGRIHPKKGLTNLIKAWKQAQLQNAAGSDWVLAIAGWDQGGYEDELKQLTRNLQIEKNVQFLGSQFNRNKELCFAHADGFILPSFSEGLPMAVLEAWAYSLPVIMTAQCNLPEGFEKGAALQTETSVESITGSLLSFFSASDNDRTVMGVAGRNLVAEKFNWESVSVEMHKVYQWMLKKGPLPETVILK